ncbi:MAG: HigA family addiction module antitoxin [Chloroflexota bacterium]|nr:HigA family addiction module antitoxin [Chloroflexota bacterium]
MPMYNPPHPGENVWHDCIEPLDMTLDEAADHLDINLRQLTAIVEGREPITLNVARRLSLGFGSTTDFWLRLQDSYDNSPIRRATKSAI